jgi:3-hydroxyacyl-CoA dehydrogenase / enoyl-CoA hydratase / 3-hydroxybutyryl-CoA epimerase / enoyl-CoA isomerase
MSAPAAETALRLDFVQPGIARITYDQPGSRANTLNQGVQTEFENILTQLDQTPNLQGLIFCSGKPGMFIAGADLKELASLKPAALDARSLTLRGLAIMGRFEKLPCPTVALIDGACMGGGTELALAMDYRLAGSHPKCEIALPETKIGIIPGWGGTQRLARLIGPGPATDLIAAGETVSATRARDLGIVFDAVPSERLLAEGRRLLAADAGAHLELRRKKSLPVGLTAEQASFTFETARSQILAKTKGHLPAPLAAVAAIEEGCNLPLDAGLAIETEHFVPLVGSPISRNLIALFFLNQRLAKDPGVADASIAPKPVERVGVVGAGIMGAGIAGAHLVRGIGALLVDVARPPLEKGLAAITKTLEARVEKKKLKPEEFVHALSRLTTSTSHAGLADCDVVIEAIVENEAAKASLLREIGGRLKPGAILASNTSTISIARLAESAPSPERFAGMHFFNPVDKMQLVEVIRGPKTDDGTVATLVALAKRLGKSPIVVRDCPGFLVNRILFPYLNEALALIEEGASPRAVDAAAVAFGMPMGPIALCDVVGLDTTRFAGDVLAAAFADRARSSPLLAELVRLGRLGQKSGAGFYAYPKGSRGVDDPALEPILAKFRTVPRAHSADEILDRLLLPMLTEAVRVVDEQIVRTVSDVDMGLILGIGWPTFRGGLLRWADSLGLDVVVSRLAKYARLGERFVPPASLVEMAKAGRRFYET